MVESAKIKKHQQNESKQLVLRKKSYNPYKWSINGITTLGTQSILQVIIQVWRPAAFLARHGQCP